MLKHDEYTDTLDLKVEHPETHELPQLPDDVVIPDDISQIAPERRRNRLVRWGWWAAALALFAGGSLYLAIQLADDSPADVEAAAVDVPAYDLKQQAMAEGTARLEDRVPDVRAYYVDLYETRLANQSTVIDVPAYDLKQQAMAEGTARLEDRVPDVREYHVNLYEARLDN